CPRRAARAHYVSTLIPTWRSRTLREVMHRPPRRGKCVLIRTESCMSASRTNSGSLVSMASIRQKARMFFFASFITTDKHHVHQQGAIVRSSRELSSKVSQRFFRGDSILPRGFQNLQTCILTNPHDSPRPPRMLELSQEHGDAQVRKIPVNTTV